MLRRSLLTAAVAAPALYAAKSVARPIYWDELEGGEEPPAIENWTADYFCETYYAIYCMMIGARPWAGVNVRAVSGPDDPFLRAFHGEDFWREVGNLASSMGIGAGAYAGLSYLRLGASAPLGLAGTGGGLAGAAFWGGWQLGTLINHRIDGTGPYTGLVNVGGRSMPYSGGGSYGSGAGSGWSIVWLNPNSPWPK